MTEEFFEFVDTPIGRLRMHGTQTALRTIYFEDHRRAAPIPEGAKHGHPMLTDVAKQLSAYFAGDPRELDCRIDLIGTEFQKSVWNLLKQIPWGTTWTYGQLAARLGKPRAARAVGHANAMNPVSIVIPCHRVVGSGGALIGYAGGKDRKRWLLEHERRFVSLTTIEL